MTTDVMTKSLHVDCLTTIGDLHALRPEWDELMLAANHTTVFQMWEWVASWYEHFGTDGSLLLLTVRNADGRLIGIAPCSRFMAKPVGPRILYLLGHQHDLTEYIGPVIHPDFLESATQEIFNAWDQCRADWDLLVLPSMPADFPFVETVHRLAVAHDYQVFNYWQGVGVRRELPGSWDAFDKSLGRGMRTNLRNSLNRLRRDGHAVRMVVAEDPVEGGDTLDLFLDLHRRRAEADIHRPHRDYFATPKRRAFLQTVTRRLAERGQVWSCSLEVDGEPVAIQLCLTYRETLYRYYSGFDPEWARHRVMTTLFRYCIERGITQGYAKLDLLLGMDEEKLRWGGAPREVVSLVLASPRLRSRASLSLYRAVHAGTAQMDRGRVWLRYRRLRRRRDAAGAARDQRTDSNGALSISTTQTCLPQTED